MISCEGGARKLAVHGSSLYWVSGFQGAPDVRDCALGICRAPGLWISHEEEEPEMLAALEGSPLALALGPSIIASTVDGLWEVGYRGGVTQLQPEGVSFAVQGGTLWWASGEEVVRKVLPSTLSPPRQVVGTAEEAVQAVAVSHDLLVWSTTPLRDDEWIGGSIVGQRLAGGDPFLVVEDIGHAFELALTEQHVVWYDHDELWGRALRADAQPVRLSNEVTAFAVHGGFVYYGTRERHQIALHRVALSGGHPTTLIAYERDTPRTILGIAVDDEHVWWSDARIMRMRLD